MRPSTTAGMCQEGIPGDKGKEGHRTGQRSSLTLGLAQEQTGQGYKLCVGTNWGLHKYKLGTGTNWTRVQTRACTGTASVGGREQESHEEAEQGNGISHADIPVPQG